MGLELGSNQKQKSKKGLKLVQEKQTAAMRACAVRLRGGDKPTRPRVSSILTERERWEEQKERDLE